MINQGVVSEIEANVVIIYSVISWNNIIVPQVSESRLIQFDQFTIRVKKGFQWFDSMLNWDLIKKWKIFCLQLIFNKTVNYEYQSIIW